MDAVPHAHELRGYGVMKLNEGAAMKALTIKARTPLLLNVRKVGTISGFYYRQK
jgi:hypothetical protein